MEISRGKRNRLTLITTESAAGVYACGRPAVTRQMPGTNHGQGEDGRGRHLSLRDRVLQQRIRKKRLILNAVLL